MDNILKILMLEDNADEAEMMLRLLKKTSLRFESLLVMNKEDFLLALEDFKPDLILSDNSLPQFNATDALEIIHERSIHVPFILVTGTVSDEFAASIIKLGADDYILKDRLERLPAAIRSALQKKRSEAAMRLKEEEISFKASLLAAVGQAIIATDVDRCVIYWNNAAKKMYGWSKAEAIGRNIIDLIISSQSKEQADQIMDQLKEGNSWSSEFLVHRKDGFVFPAFVTDSPIYDNQGIFTGIIGVSTDISERKNAERELKTMGQKMLDQKIQEQKKVSRAIIRAQEQERNHIGQELHDNVSQILAVTLLYLGMAAKKNELVKDLVKYPLELIENSIEEIRLLSSKQVTPLRNINLEILIGMLIGNLNKNTSIKTLYDYHVVSPLSDDELKLNIYRIIQIQVNNIIKHAVPSNVSIQIKEAGNFINIDVVDDGKGFDLNKKRKGIGISNMINRIESFNGKMEMESSIGKGCRMRVSMPFK
jgi:two-component system, NarL family, sensor histidine kinase UhpB